MNSLVRVVIKVYAVLGIIVVAQVGMFALFMARDNKDILIACAILSLLIPLSRLHDMRYWAAVLIAALQWCHTGLVLYFVLSYGLFNFWPFLMAMVGFALIPTLAARFAKDVWINGF